MHAKAMLADRPHTMTIKGLLIIISPTCTGIVAWHVAESIVHRLQLQQSTPLTACKVASTIPCLPR